MDRPPEKNIPESELLFEVFNFYKDKASFEKIKRESETLYESLKTTIELYLDDKEKRTLDIDDDIKFFLFYYKQTEEDKKLETTLKKAIFIKKIIMEIFRKEELNIEKDDTKTIYSLNTDLMSYFEKVIKDFLFIDIEELKIKSDKINTKIKEKVEKNNLENDNEIQKEIKNLSSLVYYQLLDDLYDI